MALNESGPSVGLALEQVSLTYARQPVLRGVDLRLERGGALLVVGENGAGKSSLLQVAAGLLEPTRGAARIAGHAAGPGLLALGIRRGVVLEQPALLAGSSVRENVELPLRQLAPRLGLTETAVRERAEHWLERVAVSPADREAPAGALSLGLGKRVALARALAFEPQYLFLDEPDLGVDAEQLDRVGQLVVELARDPSVTVLACTTSARLAARFPTRPLELRGGQLVRRASPFVAARHSLAPVHGPGERGPSAA